MVTSSPSPTFERKGDDLYVDVPVPYTDAALGGEGEGADPAGHAADHDATRGHAERQSFRLGGQDVPLRGGGAGDLHARARVTVPRTLSPGEREPADRASPTCAETT